MNGRREPNGQGIPVSYCKCITILHYYVRSAAGNGKLPKINDNIPQSDAGDDDLHSRAENETEERT